MHLPAPSPPMRGFLLMLVSKITSVPLLRDLLLLKVRADAGIPKMPEVDALPAPKAAAGLPAGKP